MGIVSSLFGSPKKGRASSGAVKNTNRRVAAQKGAAGARCLELHGSVDAAPDDLAAYTKLASHVGLLIRFSYVDQTGSLTSRAVTIDGVFGASLDDPQYLIGLCQLRKDRRMFKVRSIQSVYLPTGALVTENIEYYVTAMIRQHLGLGYAKAPLTFKEPVSLVVDVVQGGAVCSVAGVLVEYTYEIRSYGPRSYLSLKPEEPFNGSRRAIKMDMISEITGYDMKSVGSVSCGVTGETIEDFYQWAASKLSRNRDGWPFLV
jgi:hypothetical protein